MTVSNHKKLFRCIPTMQTSDPYTKPVWITHSSRKNGKINYTFFLNIFAVVYTYVSIRVAIHLERRVHTCYNKTHGQHVYVYLIGRYGVDDAPRNICIDKHYARIRTFLFDTASRRPDEKSTKAAVNFVAFNDFGNYKGDVTSKWLTEQSALKLYTRLAPIVAVIY